MELAILHADACGFSAAMAKSVDTAVAKLTAGQKLARKVAGMFGGRVVDMTGDSMLLTFGSATGAFAAARHMRDITRHQKQQGAPVTPFDFRIGIAKGKVEISGRRVFGTCINLAARIESLVARGNVGIERSAWNEVQHLASSFTARPRLIFAKPEEPAVDFFEIGEHRDGAAHGAQTENDRNAPVIELILRFGEKHERSKNAAIDALAWNCTSLFSSHDWLSRIVADDAMAGDADVTPIDYRVHLRAVAMPGGFRLVASVSSAYLRRGLQHFSRDFVDGDDHAVQIASLTSLLGSVIAHAETERVRDTKRIGSHQLVAAGRACLLGFSEAHFQRGLHYMRTALAIDPDYPLLLSSLGRAHAIAWRFGWKADGRDHMEAALEFAAAAARHAPGNPRVQADIGFIKFWNGDAADAAWHFDQSLEALPFHPELAADAGSAFSFFKDNDKGAAVLERSIANLPSDPDNRLWSLGDVYSAKGDYASALKWLSRMNDQSQAQRLLAACKARLGLDATLHVKNVLKQQPDFSVRRWVAIQPFTDEAERADYEDSLLAAGLPP